MSAALRWPTCCDWSRLRRQAAPLLRRRARSVIVLYLNGGPSQLDSWDMKPDAPAEIRGSFQPIQTIVPDVLGQRAFSADGPPGKPIRRHPLDVSSRRRSPQGELLDDDRRPMMPAREAEPRKLSRLDRPHVGSVFARLWGGTSTLPPFVMLPDRIRPTTEPHAGQHAGFLGPAYDPYLIESDPNVADFAPGSLQLDREVTAARLAARRAPSDESNQTN